MELAVSGASTQRIRLRRSRANEQTIKQNIENLKMRSQKKLVAQLKYYGTVGQSPLAREVSLEDINKAPVHQRLGLKQQNRVPVLGTNTAFLGPKRRDFRKILTNKNFNQAGSRKNFKNQKVAKLFSAQNRLLRIRNGIPPIKNQNNNVPQNQRIRLRRATSVPRNYTVRVKNTECNFRNSPIHSVKKSLNPHLQNEIRLIQEQHSGGDILDLTEAVMVTATKKTLNQRFSLLP